MKIDQFGSTSRASELPELYSRTDVEHMRIDLGETLFQLAMMNNPSGIQDLPFPETRNR